MENVGDPHINTLLLMVREVLESKKGRFAKALECNIYAYYQAIQNAPKPEEEEDDNEEEEKVARPQKSFPLRLVKKP